MTIDIPLSAKVEQWRAKVADGTITLEEMKECVAAIRAGRMSAAQASSAKRAPGAKKTVNVDDLMDGLEGL